MNDPVSAQLEWCVSPQRTVSLEPFMLMGILNITPDSFSDGGRWLDPDQAIARALVMIDEGAKIIDIGGESTRPGARRMPAKTQLSRVVPVIRRLRAATDVILSIDTTLCEVAEAALDAGAEAINDVSACTEDDGMIALAAERRCGVILMHRVRPPEAESFSDKYAKTPRYDDVVSSVRSFLTERVDAVTSGGVDHRSIVVDPGLGFGKSVEQNMELIARSGEIGLIDTQVYPVIGAASRKSFIGKVGDEASPERRAAGSLAASVLQYREGIRIFRVHDVAAHREALSVAAAILRSKATREGD